MGVAAGGFIIPFDGTLEDACNLLIKIESIPLYKLHENYVDTRNKNYFSLSLINGYLVVFHADYYFKAFNDPARWGEKLRLFGLLDQVIMFGIFDSGGHYGYSIYQNAKLIRNISQDATDDYQIVQFGDVLDVEKVWLNADICYEYSYLDENDEWQEKLIDGKDLDISSLEEGEIDDYLRCRYTGTIDNSIAEHSLVSTLFSDLCLEIIKIDFICENINIHMLLSTSEGISQIKQESEETVTKASFFTKIKQLWKK
ncbi:hypothetical protein SKM54_09015 [Acinetobacter faecalis]|uniref:hypothetical protein n=1 Tax=Acinetobacter faecalis TaxID=2665161 RepID=UPI002A918830|nr:hypothetical protein [Acinetobacter faecalis]MDY6482583.1 hypothetical protein [Acinetobacter faecalis]